MGRRKTSYHSKKRNKLSSAAVVSWRKKKEACATQENQPTEEAAIHRSQNITSCENTECPENEGKPLPHSAKYMEQYECLPPLTISSTKEPNSWDNLMGNRIFHPGHVLPTILDIQNRHTIQCTTGKIQFQKEVRRGLFCQWILSCDMCEKTFAVTNEEPSRNIINSVAVWAATTSGIGFSQFENVMNVLDVPVMSKNTFFRNEEKIGKVWEEHLWKSIHEAGTEERRLAIERGDIDEDGVPFITVIVDGGWSKRTYGHNYNASSGTAVIIGERTGKLLFMGVRNKYCCICERATNREEEKPPHTCYKNWERCRPSTAMEQDILVEGFKTSELLHGLRYKYFIGDGDSSVYARLMQNVPYGRSIHKIECANHCVRNYTGHLHNLASDKTFCPQNRKVLKALIPRLTAAARGAIKHCASTNDSVEDLVKDLRNGPFHVFGEHTSCRSYFCKKDENEKVAILNDSALMRQIEGLVQRLVVKAPRLIQNKTSNSAEFFMSLLAKHNAGKRINYTQRGAFQRRCSVASLRFQKGHQWEVSPFKKLTGVSPGKTHKNVIKKKCNQHRPTKRRKLLYEETEDRAKRRKISSPPDEDYGPNADDPDDAESLRLKCEEYASKLKVTEEERDKIVLSTIDQVDSDLWHELRGKRLTASQFGAVCKRKDTTPCANLVKQLLYKPLVTTAAMEYGQRNEYVAIKLFEKETGLIVKPCGLFIDLQNYYLGASPDGLVKDDGLVEVKCVPSVRGMGLKEAAKQKKNFCLALIDDTLALRKNHNYFYQIQGQLNITGRSICYFVVMSDPNEKIHIQEIKKDSDFWEKQMVPKLHRFYFKCILPELADPNVVKGKRIREPQYIFDAQNALQCKKKELYCTK